MSAPRIFTAPVTKQTNKPDLVEVATALGLSTAGVKYDIYDRIERHLQDHPSLANEKQFQGLFSGRASNPKKGTSKNSADKAADDALEEQKGYREGKATTAAHKKLLEKEYTTDPPARFAKLDSGVDVSLRHSDEESELGGDDDQTSVPPSHYSNENSDEQVEKPGVNPKVIKNGLIMVVFEPENDRQAPTREGHVSGVPVFLEEDSEGPRYTARLSDLLPEAFKQDPGLSPVKKSRLYRKGVADPDSHMTLGHVDEVLNPTSPPRSLKVEHLNRYPLERRGGDTFACRLFYKEVDNMAEPSASHASNKPIIFGDTDDEISPYPLKVARARAAEKKEANVQANDEQKEPKIGFNGFLRDYLGVSVDDLPTERGTTMKIILARYMLVKKCLDKLQAWTYRGGPGGYAVPPFPDRHGEFAGLRFTKIHIYGALGLKATRASGDERLFSDRSLRGAPKAQDWVQNPETSAHRKKFENMTMSAFRDYLLTRQGKAPSLKIDLTSDGEGAGGSSGQAKRKEVKRRRAANGSSSDEESDRAPRKVKKSKKGKKVVDSDDLDESE